MMTKLVGCTVRKRPRPCPFCGTRPVFYLIETNDEMLYMVRCEEDLCWPNPIVQAPRSLNDAILRWNLTPAKVRERRKLHDHFEKVRNWKVQVPAIKPRFVRGQS